MMRKLAVFSIFLMVFGITQNVNASFVIQLPSTPNYVKAQDQSSSDGYIINNAGQKIVIFCSRYGTGKLQEVATKMNAIAYNIKDQSSFPVAAGVEVVCKHGSMITNDTFTLQYNHNSFLSPPKEYNILPGSLYPFALSQVNQPNTTNDIDIGFTYYNGCPESRNGARDNFYLTSKNKCGNNCPIGAEQKEIAIGNHIVTLIYCNDKALSDKENAEKQKKQDDLDKKNSQILAQKKANCLAAGGIWDTVNNKCACKDDKVWVDGQCVVPAAVCPKDTVDWLQNLITSGSYDKYTKEIKDKIDDLMKICIKQKQSAQEKFDSDVKDLKRLIEKFEETKSQKIKDSETSIKNLYSGLTEVERSVWTDKEGDFNKSRLISDSVAGVVLGTAGGLITSSIIKKNQTENGFEDISCTVGGQVVAGWNDEFTVGIR